MLPSTLSFRRAVSSLRAFLAFQSSLDAALRLGCRVSESGQECEAALADLASAAGKTTLKRYVHTLVVMELHGAVEQLVDGLVRDYLTRLTSNAKSVHDLPVQLVEAHTRKSIELLRVAERLPFAVSTRDVVRNLHHCFEAANYRLNFDAFTFRFANMRTAQIRLLFAELGVEHITRRAFDAPSYQQFILRTSRMQTAAGDGNEFPELDELVEYRNEAAHGSPSTVLSLQELSRYIEFGEALGEALDQAVQGASIAAFLTPSSAQLGRLIKVYANRIICLELASPLCVGDSVAARTPEGQFRWGEVACIEENGVRIAAADTGKVVGVEVGFLAKPNQQFFKLPW